MQEGTEITEGVMDRILWLSEDGGLPESKGNNISLRSLWNSIDSAKPKTENFNVEQLFAMLIAMISEGGKVRESGSEDQCGVSFGSGYGGRDFLTAPFARKSPITSTSHKRKRQYNNRDEERISLLPTLSNCRIKIFMLQSKNCRCKQFPSKSWHREFR